MSLLEQLNAKRKCLKPTDTTITQIDGQKYLECKNKRKILPKNEYGFVVDTKPDDVPAKITEHLYLGSQDCCELRVLQQYNIDNILSVGIDAPQKYDFLNYKYIPCLDLPDTEIAVVLQESIPYIEASVEQKLNILVHCNAGVSRSSSVVIGYLMCVRGCTYSEAFGIVKSVRSCIQPNPGFRRQLENFNLTMHLKDH